MAHAERYTRAGRPTGDGLPPWARVLAVIAHPDDESFGLGAVIDRFVVAGTRVDVLCFTHGEASTLGGEQDLCVVRAAELRSAGHELGIQEVRLLGHPDGGLESVDPAVLADQVSAMAIETHAQGLLVFDSTGVTSHPDHVAATTAARRAGAALGIGVLAWTLPAAVAEALGSPFVGRPEDEIDVVLAVDRSRQRRAITCHPSQAVPGSALWNRLELLGDREHLRWIPPRPSPADEMASRSRAAGAP